MGKLKQEANSDEKAKKKKKRKPSKNSEEKFVAFCFTAKMNGGPSGFSALILFPEPNNHLGCSFFTPVCLFRV